MTTGAGPSRWRGAEVLGAAVVPLVVCAVVPLLRGDVADATAVLVLVLVVVAAASTGNRLAGIVAGLSSGAWFDFFLTEPRRTFAITDPEDVEVTVLLVVISLAVTELALLARRAQARASRRAGFLQGILESAEITAAGRERPQTVLQRAATQIAAVLGADACRYLTGPVRDPRLAVLDHHGDVLRDGERVPVEREGLPTEEFTALEVLAHGAVVGHFVVTTATRTVRPTLEQRRVAVLLADQVAGAAERA